MLRKSLAALSRMWRTFYKPMLDNLFRESKSAGVRLMPDVAIDEMEQAFRSLFFSVDEASADTLKNAPRPSRRLYFRFDRTSFRREAHHYAVDCFYDTYFPSKHASTRAHAKIVGGGHKRLSIKRGAPLLSQPQMIREVLLKHGGPLQAEAIGEAIKRTFNVNLKKSDITSVIYRAMKSRNLFRRVGVNTFATA